MPPTNKLVRAKGLMAAGGTLDDVVKVTVYLADVNDRQKVNEVCSSRSRPSPSRARLRATRDHLRLPGPGRA